MQVTRDEKVLFDFLAGDIVGSSLIMSGAVAQADAAAVEPVRGMRWDVATLERYLHANPETRIRFQKYLARDLTEKVRHLMQEI